MHVEREITMGMAASQARFLGLTARQNNVEYEGQQVNQQRTTLANQSANYYNQLLGMSVPVPPSTADFTKTVYTFQDGNLSNSITALIAQPNGEYLVSYVSSWQDDWGVVSARSSLINELVKFVGDADFDLYEAFTQGTAGGCYTYALDHDGNQLNHLEHTLCHLLNIGTYTTSDGNTVTVSSGDHWWSQPSGQFGGDGAIMGQIANKIDGSDVQQKFVDLLYACRHASAADSDDLKDRLQTVVENDLRNFLLQDGTYMIGADELRKVGYIPDVERDDTGKIVKYNGNDKYLKTLSPDQLNNLLIEERNYIKMLTEKYGSTTWFTRYIQNTTTGTWQPYFYSMTDLKDANYDDNTWQQSHINCYTIGVDTRTEEVKNVSARLEKDATGRYINIVLYPNDPEKQVSYALTTNTITDQARYEDAMNQYEYDKYQYDQSIQEINAKIEIIQAEDKNLELRLKQLDTEQKAIQSEKEAVEKVVQKNVESTFKTFG